MVVFALAVGLVAVVFAVRIGDRQEEVRRVQQQTRELLDLRGVLRQGYITFWENRFDGGDGLNADVQAQVAAGVIRINGLIDAAGDDPVDRHHAAAVRTDVANLLRVVGADYSATTVGGAADRAAVERARTVINRLDTDVLAWAGAKADHGDLLESELRRTTDRLLLLLGILVVGLGLIATVVWIFVERTRFRILRGMQYEHASRGAVLESVSDGLAVVDADGAASEHNARMLEILGRRSLPEGEPMPYLGEADIPDDFVGERDLEITRPDGTTIPVIFSSTPLDDTVRGMRVHALKEVTQRKRAEHALERMAAEQGALGHVATAVAAESDPERIFELVAREVAALLDASGAIVSRFDRDADRAATVGTWARDPDAAPMPERIPLAVPSVIRSVLRNGIPARHAAADASSEDLLASSGYPVSVSAPIRVEASVWGALTAATTAPELLPPGSEMRLARFAELVGIAVANADARTQLALRATTDPLTGVLNHRTFHERLEREFANADGTGRGPAIILLDLDHFKDVNDTFGHQSGDRVLRTFARFVESRARLGDLVARIGGEEFALLLPGADLKTAARVADRLVSGYAEIDHDDGVGNQTVSAGVADASLAAGPDELKRLADAALYRAKASGRNRSVVATADILREVSGDERIDQLTRSRTVAALQALARAIDAKDSGTARHSERVAVVATAIARTLDWPAGRIDALHEAALLHDVGKIGVPDELLLKTAPLTGEEREQLRIHAILGAEIVTDVFSNEQIAWVRSNHERWDGSGYPDGLAGDAIPLGAQILAVADAWDAMTSAQSYRDPLSVSEALDELRRGRGRDFAPRVVDVVEALAAAGMAPFDARA